MTTFAAFGRRLEAFDIVKTTGDQLQNHREEVRDLNIQQLMQGLNSEGRPLSPKYSEDSYFKKPGAWERYARWKKRLFPDTPFDRPNLIITGYYHNSITADRQGNEVQFRASASFASSIANKYGSKELGLSPDSKQKAWKIVKPEVVREFCRVTGAKPSQ